jgi:hypothetical protein
MAPRFLIRGSETLPRAILPGSFNPLHHGHTALAAVAAARLGVPVAFELSIANVDKPDLSREEVLRRAGQFAGVGEVWVTRAATFAEKAELFPGAAFVVGFDTAVRLVDPSYYRGETASRDECLRRLQALRCRVIVGGRLDGAGRFCLWEECSLDPAFRDLFVPLSEADFRADVSSTALRAAR